MRTRSGPCRARMGALLNAHALLRHTTVPQAWAQWMTAAGMALAVAPAACAQSGQIVHLSPVTWTSDKAYYLRFPDWKASMPQLKAFAG